MITGKKIESMLKESWEKFIEYFDINAAKYSREYFDELSKSLTEKKAKNEVKEAHWICWNESDLMVQLSRYFYDRLKIIMVLFYYVRKQSIFTLLLEKVLWMRQLRRTFILYQLSKNWELLRKSFILFLTTIIIFMVKKI